jgi:hypothetical protein
VSEEYCCSGGRNVTIPADTDQKIPEGISALIIVIRIIDFIEDRSVSHSLEDIYTILRIFQQDRKETLLCWAERLFLKHSLKANDEVFMYVINHLMQQQLVYG